MQQLMQQFSIERASLEKQLEDEYERQNEQRGVIQTLMEEKNTFQGILFIISWYFFQLGFSVKFHSLFETAGKNYVFVFTFLEFSLIFMIIFQFHCLNCLFLF